MDITPSKCATQLPRRRLLARDAESFIEGTGEVGELSSAFLFPTTAARLPTEFYIHTIESILLDTIALHIAEVNLLFFFSGTVYDMVGYNRSPVLHSFLYYMLSGSE